jgi:hypothetical protein
MHVFSTPQLALLLSEAEKKLKTGNTSNDPEEKKREEKEGEDKKVDKRGRDSEEEGDIGYFGIRHRVKEMEEEDKTGGKEREKAAAMSSGFLGLKRFTLLWSLYMWSDRAFRNF